jgi:hypothetical protein
MSNGLFTLAGLPRLLLDPHAAFTTLAENPRDAGFVFTRLALWLGVLPPIFAWIGMSKYGWQLGAVDAIHLPASVTLGIAALYFICLLFGFISVTVVARWMAATYGAKESLGAYFGLFTIVGAPLTVGSVMHLYPHVFFNLLVLVPSLIWSMFLLYRGLPVALGLDSQRGMLMASSIIGYLFVAFVSLLGISAFLWTKGIGPRIGV